ncbi:MAG: AzlD domain-containing protein [Clostridiales Family XIII bacterium]|nr:AzlD domain-containing protein [Clostridiales Family XIII bacterium]
MTLDKILYSIAIIALMSAVTFAVRVFPFALFGKGGQTPKLVRYLGNVLPPAVMMALIVYCFRDLPFRGAEGYMGAARSAAAILTVVILYKLTKNSLIAMVAGTLLYMVLAQAVFA